MIRLTDTHTFILTSAASRPGMLAMPPSKGLHGATAKKVVTLMTKRGLIEEVGANLFRGELLWRETGDGHGTTLIATGAGLASMGIERVLAPAVTGLRKPCPDPQEYAPVMLRKGTKPAELIELLKTSDGVSIHEITAVTCWQLHSVRGVVSGQPKKEAGVGFHLGEGRGPGGVPHRCAGRMAQRRRWRAQSEIMNAMKRSDGKLRCSW